MTGHRGITADTAQKPRCASECAVPWHVMCVEGEGRRGGRARSGGGARAVAHRQGTPIVGGGGSGGGVGHGFGELRVRGRGLVWEASAVALGVCDLSACGFSVRDRSAVFQFAQLTGFPRTQCHPGIQVPASYEALNSLDYYRIGLYEVQTKNVLFPLRGL